MEKQMLTVQEAGKQKRVTRRPKHTFNLTTRPFQIQPFLIAPVLPGETMDFLLMQARAITDPLANPLIGWWKEYYFFYVKHRDLAGRDDFTEMMLDSEKDLSSYTEAANVKYYHSAGTLNWAKLCLVRVVEEYFRNEGEAWDDTTIDGMPLAGINHESWLNSVISGDNYSTDDFDADLNADDTYTAAEIVKATNMWFKLRERNLTDKSYEDYLRDSGVSVPDAEEPHTPELIRYVRDWTYPTNVVDPSTGSPTSAASWSIAERADKNRYFKEPGFIFGVTVTRPKVYLQKVDGGAVDYLNDAFAWLPAIMHQDPQTSLREQADDDGPLATIFTDTGGYWWDAKDLFLYGDQFINYDYSSVTDKNFVALPEADLSRRFISSTDADNFYSGDDKTIREDGVVDLSIRSVLTDTTPGHTLPGVTA
jgi:hypothetical protein